jgi:hypothetical protein
MSSTKRKQSKKHRARRATLTKKFRGGEYDATKVVDPEERSDSRDSTTTYSGSHYAENVNKVLGKEALDKAYKQNMPALPPGSFLGLGVAVGVVSVGAYFLIASN